MPYFSNDMINLLFIHIPKTGGTSLEYYFSQKYNIKLNQNSLHTYDLIEFYEKYGINLTLQHYTYNNIIEFNNILNVNFENLEKITIVRNPYAKIISDLFYKKLININSTKDYVYNIINKYINENNHDNHNIPQYKFIIDNDNNLLHDIKIFKTETLNDNMIANGYTDFNININTNQHKINYIDYLNNNSINLINNFYDKDFNYFNYNKLNYNYKPISNFYNDKLKLNIYKTKTKTNTNINTNTNDILQLKNTNKPKFNLHINNINNRLKLNSNLYNKSI